MRLRGQHNKQATISPEETPKGQPETCIKTFENDVWYQFVGDTAYQWYEVVVEPFECSTPAGLQALIIEAPSCDKETFVYRACANPYKDEPLRLFLRKVHHGAKYYVHVDGYDGTQCDFSISLSGIEEPFVDFSHLQNDYTPSPVGDAGADTPLLRLETENNEMTLLWEDDTQSNVQGFLVERWYEEFGKQAYGGIIGRVAPQQSVGTGTATYSFIDAFTPLAEGIKYCYRLVRVGEEGRAVYGQPVCHIVAHTIVSFSVSPVNEDPEHAGFYVVQYDNRSKQDLTFRILDAEKKELKVLVRAKEPRHASTLTINMAPYPAGVYYLRAEAKEGYFLRQFIKD